MSRHKSIFHFNMLLLAIVSALILFPLAYYNHANYSSSDENVAELIAREKPQHQPWFAPVWEPPGKEVESFIFVLQGALGAGFVGFYLGYLKGKKEGKKE